MGGPERCGGKYVGEKYVGKKSAVYSKGSSERIRAEDEMKMMTGMLQNYLIRREGLGMCRNVW